MILSKPKSVGSVGRDELAKRVDDFEGGRWVELLEAAFAFTQGMRHRTHCTEEEDMIRRGRCPEHHELTGTWKPTPSCDVSVTGIA